MLAAHNILKPSDGKPVVVPTQDMVLGSYYLTIDKDGVKGEGKVFATPEEVIMAYQLKEVDIHAKIKVRLTRVVNGELCTGIIQTTPGKILFNESIPQDLGYIDRSIPE